MDKHPSFIPNDSGGLPEYDERLSEVKLYVAHVSREAGSARVKFVVKR